MCKTVVSSALLLASCLFITLFSTAQPTTVRFEQLDSLQTVQQRPVVVFLSTSWCRYCAALKNTTLKNQDVMKTLNGSFYFVHLAAEEKADIHYRGKTFRYRSTGVNELAENLGTVDGSLQFPLLCFLNPKDEIIYQQQGYITAKHFLSLLQALQDTRREVKE